MVDTAWSVDWLSATFKQDGVTDLTIRKALSFGYKHKQWAEIAPKFGYEAAYQHPMGHIVFANVYRPEMGVHLACGGRALKEMAQAGTDAASLIKWAIDHGGKISRLDLAIDVFGEDINPVVWAKLPRVKDAPGSARKWSVIEGDDGGSTAYIGSRKSDKFMRVYDKAAEQGLKDVRWVRFELEIKGDRAREAANQLIALDESERGGFIKGLMRGLWNPDHELYQEIMDGAMTVYLPTTRRTEDKTYQWVMNVCARSVAALMISRQDLPVWDEFVQQVHANMVAKGITFNEDDEAGA